MLSNTQINQIQEKGYFRVADAMPTLTPNNIGIPAGILSNVSPDIVETILAYRTGDEALGGRKKLLDFEKQEFYLPLVEKTGGRCTL